MFIDVAKAYGTVWREAAYTKVHDMGMRGKLWRQLQKMHENLSRRVLTPAGLTARFPVTRGVAQGAIESPWLYACFVDGLVKELRRRAGSLCRRHPGTGSSVC